MSEHKEPIPSMIYNASVGGHVTNSQQIIDENENKEQSQINAEIKETLGQGGSVDSRINQAKNDIIGGASSNGNTLKKIEDRVSPLESAVGSGGSVDSRIATAKSEIKGDATSNCDTLGKAEAKINANATAISAETSRAQTAEEQLRTLYNNLQQSQPIPVTSLPATGEAGKIYRLAGTTSYSDYMWDGTQFVKMAEYDNAIDDEPTDESNNLVKSGGVYNKTMAPQQTSLFNKNPVAPNYNDVIVSGVSTFDLYKSILYAKIVGVAGYNVNRTYSIGYMEYGELKSDQRRSFRIVLKEYNPTTNTWERSSIEAQNYDILPIGTLDNAIYHISTVNANFKAEFIIDFSCMTFGQSVTLDGGWSSVPKFIMNNKWVDATEIENLNMHSSEDFNCFRKRLPNSVNTGFYSKGGSSDVNKYTCFDIFRSILSLKLYDFDEGLYGIRYIARGETETLIYRVILVKYNESNNTWEDYFDTGNMLALEQEQGNSIITIDKTISNKRIIMEIDFNLTPSIGFYASLYASGVAPQFVIKQDCFVAKQSSETVADFIQDLPVSDGSTISSGYAYIDSATYNVKVKQ